MGGVNISNKIHFTLILALILISGISASSANEINNTNPDSTVDNTDTTNNIMADNNLKNNNVSNKIKTETSQKLSSPNSNNNLITTSPNEQPVTTEDNQIKENKNSHLSLTSTSLINGKTLNINLKNSAGIGIPGQILTITFDNKKYTKTTNADGQCNFAINHKTGLFPITIIYNGNENYFSTTESFKIKVYKQKTKITVDSKSVIRGKYLHLYLKDINGNAISRQKVTITINKKKYLRITDINGCFNLKMNYNATKYYSVKVKHKESISYLASSKSFKVKVYKQKTKLIVINKSVKKGKYLHIFLKNSKGKAIPSKLITIKFNKKSFKKHTNKNGEIRLKITSKPGKYHVKIKYSGSATYKSTSKSFTLKSYLAKSKIEVSSSKIVKGNYLYVYLKSSANKALPHKKIVIKFNNKKYSKTTNSKGRISLKINVKADTYKTTIKFSGSKSYLPCSKTLTITVVDKIHAKIIANDETSVGGTYSVRLIDIYGNPIANKPITIYAYDGFQSVGSKISITKRTIVLNSDNIYNTATDKKLLNNIATILKSKGYSVIVNPNLGPNVHCSDITGKYSDVCVFCIFGGVDSGMFVDISSKWYQNYLNRYNNEVVLGFTRTSRNLAIETWLERSHDDNYSPSSFTGLANPGTYLNNHGFDYVYGDTASQLAENFINYAINGLSIGKNNILPGIINTYNVNTDENGYATISGLSEGYYKLISSCSSTNEYIVDSVTSYLTVI